MTHLSELDPQDDKFKSILVPLAKDLGVLQAFFLNKASACEKYKDAYWRTSNTFARALLVLHDAYPRDVQKPLTEVEHSMGGDMPSILLSLNLLVEGIKSTEEGMAKKARSELLRDAEYAHYKDAVFKAAQQVTTELMKVGITQDDLTNEHLHGLRDALSYASPSKPPSRRR
ncbi:MAG: hypothetical protein LW823_05115 [Rickettsiales bacterium]|nr:hypothetical protein [Rickettsiales bacterium]